MTTTHTAALTSSSPIVIAGTPGRDAEPPQIARTGDDVFILWHEFPVGGAVPDVYLARSTDKGARFGTRINLSDTPAGDSREEDIAVTRSGNDTRVYVVWAEDATRIVFRRDRTNDGTFSNAIDVNDTLGNVGAGLPRIAASGNNVFVVWQATGPSGEQDIFFARSTNSGDTFKDKQNISNNNGASEAPQLTLLGDDRVIVTWRDDSGGNGHEIFFVRIT